MKKMLSIILVLVMIAPNGFARAGKSYSRSTGFTSRPTPSPVYKPVMKTPVYNTAPRPMANQTSHAPVAAVHPTPVATVHPTPIAATTPVSNTTHTTINKTTVIHRDGGNGYGNNGGGMGIGGTILGVAGGVVAGNVLTEMLMGDHRNAGYAPAGGYASTPQGYPVAGQQVAPAMVGATSGNYVTDGKGGIISAPTPSDDTSEAIHNNGVVNNYTSGASSVIAPVEEDHSFLKVMGYILGGVILIAIIIWLIGRYRTMMTRKNEIKDMLELETNLTIFKNMFISIQNSYMNELNPNLIHLVTKPMYEEIIQTRDKNADEGLTNIMEDIQIHSMVTQKNWEEDKKKFQQVKIRFSMIDYTINEKGELEHGSKTNPETVVEYWTFESVKKGEWALSSINQHNGYVHQAN